MFRLSASAIRKWEKTRAIGLLRYVVVYGVLLWGALSGALFSLFKVLLDPSIGYLSIATYAMPIFMVGGVMWGVGAWYLTEWQYRATKNGPV